MSEMSPNPERAFGFSLPDSETSEHPMAGTIVDQIIALQEMGETELADNLIAQERQNLADAFASEDALVRRIVEQRQENGRQWLHELTYGAEKMQQFCSVERRLKGKSVIEFAREAENIQKAATKLEVVQGTLEKLIDTRVILSPLDDAEGSSSTGTIVAYDILKGTIQLREDGKLKTVPFCEVLEHDEYGFIVKPLIEMQADETYTY